MALLVIDFSFLEGRDGELVVKELAFAYSQTKRLSSFLFKSPYTWEELPTFNAKINSAIDHGCNWNDGDIMYSELENILHRESSSAVAIYCFGAQKATFISTILQRTVINIVQLGCPQLAELAFSSVCYTFPCHWRSKYCAMRSAYAVARWLEFHTLILQCAECPTQPYSH